MPPQGPDNDNRNSLNELKSNERSSHPDAFDELAAPTFVTLEKRHWVLGDVVRVILILLGLAVAGALTIVILPQPMTDRIIRKLEARHSASNPEQIGFLYLGDETAGNEFRVRGVVRNIAARPIDQLDAIIRLYSNNRTLLETAVVRMSRETIDPGAIAQFELVYPEYSSAFGSYSVEFKLRQGSVMPYKDMRTLQERQQ
jgi:hypothetical protein